MGSSYKFRKRGGRHPSRATHRSFGFASKARFSRVQRAIRREGLLAPPGDIQAGPELLAHEVGELHSDPMDVFHRPSERLRTADQLVDRLRHGELCGRPIRTDRTNDLERDELRLRPDAEAD